MLPKRLFLELLVLILFYLFWSALLLLRFRCGQG